jgi:two-component system sensor histidine kinase/response regulator
MKLSNIKIAGKLYLVILIAAVGIAGMAWISAHNMEKVYVAANYANVNTVPSILALDDALTGFYSMRIAVRDHVMNTDLTKMATIDRVIQSDIEKIDKALANYLATLISDAEDRRLTEVDRSFFKEYLTAIDGALGLSRQNKNDQAYAVLNTSGAAAAAKFLEALQQHMEFNKKLGASGAAEALAVKVSAVRTSIFAALMILAAIGIVSWLIANLALARPIGEMVGNLLQLSQGKLEVMITGTERQDEVGDIARASQVFKEFALKLENQGWIKKHVAEISSRLQHADDYSGLAREFLSAACPLLGAGHGVLYLHEENELRMLGAYGWRERKNLNLKLALGEGLLGQSALEKQPITITHPPEDYIKIGSALGEATPRAVSVLPIMQTGQLLGMLELASFQPASERETALLDALIPVLATTMQILERNINARRLMKEAQERATQMETQAAQLEEQSVEMEAQQAELLKTEDWYRSIVEAANAMLVVNEQGIIVLCNPQAETLFGYAAGELAGQRVDALLPSWAQADVQARLMAADDPLQKNALMNLNALCKDGSEVAIEAAFNRLPESGDKGACACVSVRDLTGRAETPAT